MGGHGIQIGSDTSGEDGGARDLSLLDDEPRIPPGLPEMDSSLPPPASPGSWLRDWMQLAGVEGMSDQPPTTAPPMPIMDRYWQNDQGMEDRRSRIDAQAKAILPPAKGTKGPVLAGNASGTQRPGMNSKTALPLYFAKAMGYAVPGEPGDEEEARFAAASHKALLKMTKGMTVARFLTSHQSQKTRDTFGKLLDAELAKGTQAPKSVVNTPYPELASSSRPPVQPL